MFRDILWEEPPNSGWGMSAELIWIQDNSAEALLRGHGRGKEQCDVFLGSENPSLVTCQTPNALTSQGRN